VTSTQTLALSFEVRGLPPVRNGALSLFAAGHRQAGRVRALLEAALDAAQRTGWTPLTAPIALEVVVRRPDGQRTPDATTMLGGIADVLRDKRDGPHASLAHLGVLVDVALYRDDRQIRQIGYREEPADLPSYLVRVAALESAV
jgi:hypothetical protein